MRPMSEAPKDGRYILVKDDGIGPSLVRWSDGGWDTGYGSEIDGDRILAEFPVGWWPVPDDFPKSR